MSATGMPTSLPSIEDLGRRIAALYVEHNRCDTESVHADGQQANLHWQAGMDITDAQAIAAKELICTMPAVTLADAAVQVATALTIADQIDGAAGCEQVLSRLQNKLDYLLLSALPVIAEAAGLGMEDGLGRLGRASGAPIRGFGGDSMSRAISRRAAFGNAAAVMLPIGAGAATRPAHPDAELLALCRTFDDLQRQYLVTDFDCDSGSPADLAAEAERDRLEAVQDPLVNRIADLQAHTSGPDRPGSIASGVGLRFVQGQWPV